MEPLSFERARGEGSYRFSTAFGVCTLFWNEHGVSSLVFPTLEAGNAHALSSVPGWVAHVASSVVRHLEGTLQDLRWVPLDDRALTPFARRVYAALREVPPGQRRSYGDLAARVGARGAARAVGGALGRNPWLLLVPCHRVVGAGNLGGFSGPGGLWTKRRLLELEGIALTASG